MTIRNKMNALGIIDNREMLAMLKKQQKIKGIRATKTGF